MVFTAGGTFSQSATFEDMAPILDTGGQSVTWSGQLTGAGDLAVTGSGTLILTNATNNYTGDTFNATFAADLRASGPGTRASPAGKYARHRLRPGRRR